MTSDPAVGKIGEFLDQSPMMAGPWLCTGRVSLGGPNRTASDIRSNPFLLRMSFLAARNCSPEGFILGDIPALL